MRDAVSLKVAQRNIETERDVLSSEHLHTLQAVEQYYFRYAECISDDELERLPDFFTDACIYKIMPRRNYDRDLPIAILLSESKGGMTDRVVAIRKTMVYAPRYVFQQVTNIRIVSQDGPLLNTRSMVSVYQTLPDGDTGHLLVGRTFDKIDTSQSPWKFTERVVLYDTELLPATVIYPI